jgi:hypothetical protein
MKTTFKFSIQSQKFGNARIVNIRAFSLEEAEQKLRFERPKLFLTSTVLLQPFHKVIEDFDFNYEGEVYKNYIATI